MKGSYGMEYIHEPVAKNFEDFASGRVLYNAHGTTAFPVRLASELIQRCFDLLQKKGNHGPYSIYDPCCGGAFLLTVIALLHGRHIGKIFASDVKPEMMEIAVKNLSLLTATGIRKREEQIKELLALYQKPSHSDALESVEKLSKLIKQSSLEETSCFQRDITATEHSEILKNINVVITDLPYGNIVSWDSDASNTLDPFFDNIYESLDPYFSVVAVIANKSQKLKHDKFRRVQHFKIGKRQVGIFEPISLGNLK
jgi:type I restriction-modification system DNA methylase subunit